jgi:hypothetical protein
MFFMLVPPFLQYVWRIISPTAEVLNCTPEVVQGVGTVTRISRKNNNWGEKFAVLSDSNLLKASRATLRSNC